MMPGPLSALLAKHTVLLLDGAMGTELQKRGANTILPLWSARALLDAADLVSQIHIDYISAGAHILTSNTFRTTPRTFRRAGIIDRSEELTRRAVDLALAARYRFPGRDILVAGSLAPLEDCYRPDLVPADSELAEEHALQARRLADAGADFLLLETFGTVREALHVCEAAAATGKEVVLSFLCTPDGMLYGGESLEAAVTATFPCKPAGYSVNCVAARSITKPLAELQRILQKHRMIPEVAVGAGIPGMVAPDYRPFIAAYGNAGRPGDERKEELIEDVDAGEYGRLAAEWITQGASIVGGCCGTTPEHIASIGRSLN